MRCASERAIAIFDEDVDNFAVERLIGFVGAPHIGAKGFPAAQGDGGKQANLRAVVMDDHIGIEMPHHQVELAGQAKARDFL